MTIIIIFSSSFDWMLCLIWLDYSQILSGCITEFKNQLIAFPCFFLFLPFSSCSKNPVNDALKVDFPPSPLLSILNDFHLGVFWSNVHRKSDTSTKLNNHHIN